MKEIKTKVGTMYINKIFDNDDLFTLLDENKKFVCSFGDTPSSTKEEKVEQLKNINHISDLADLEFVDYVDYGSTPKECYNQVCETIYNLYGDIDFEELYPYEEFKDTINKIGNTYFVADSEQ